MNAADCSGSLVSLDEYRYMDVEELQRNHCFGRKFLDLYFQMTDTREISACIKAQSLTAKVLRKEHNAEPFSKEECVEKYPATAH